MEKDNASLKETNKRLEIKLTELKTAGPQLSSTNQTKTSLVIGSSMVRDIDADKLLDTEVICLPGGHIKDVHDYLRKSHRTFKDVTILVGGNDCAARTDPEPVEELLHKYKDMAVEANRLTQDVRVATVIPRIPRETDNTDIPDRIEAFNAGLVSMCQDSEHLELINNDDYFRLKDGEINDGYILQDGTHLTKNGTNKLAKSLRLKTATSNSDITKTGKRRGYNEVLKSAAPSSSRQAGTQATVQPVRPTHARSWSSRAGSGVSSGGETVNERAVGPVGSRPNTWDWRGEQRDDVGRGNNHRPTNEQSNFNAPSLPRCFKCYETNHMSDSCRHQHKVTCFKCGGRGHKEKHCF